MPGPFPGMDPYLEHSTQWADLHASFIVFARSAIRAALPPGYIAKVEERVNIPPSERSIIPDVFVRRYPLPASLPTGTVAVMNEQDAPGVIRVPPLEARREGYIDIVDAADRERVVTTIEVLSPANKAPDNSARAGYLEKQQAILNSRTHSLEIDLLRTGTPTIAAPIAALEAEGVPWNYLVCLHRAEQDWAADQTFEVWFNRIRQPLPRVRVPLDAGIADVELDLQAVLNRCYDEAGYGDVTDYTREPIPPLNAEDALWADEMLRERGLRS